MTCTYVCAGTPGRRREPAQGSAISSTACQSFQVKSVSEAGVWPQGIDVWKKRRRGGGGGGRLPKALGDHFTPRRCLLGAQAERSLAWKLGFHALLTFTFPVRTPQGSEQGFSEG